MYEPAWKEINALFAKHNLPAPPTSLRDELVWHLLAYRANAQRRETPVTQEPKYKFENGQVINRASGEAIPEEEPVFVFRARDVKARPHIMAYALAVDNPKHREIVLKRVEDFKRFEEDYPNRMKHPDTEI